MLEDASYTFDIETLTGMDASTQHPPQLLPLCHMHG